MHLLPYCVTKFDELWSTVKEDWQRRKERDYEPTRDVYSNAIQEATITHLSAVDEAPQVPVIRYDEERGVHVASYRQS